MTVDRRRPARGRRRQGVGLATVGLFVLAALAVVEFHDPAQGHARPFSDTRFARVVPSADAFGLSGEVRLRLALPNQWVEYPLAVAGDPSAVRYAWTRVGDTALVDGPRALAGAYVAAPAAPGFYQLTLIRGEAREVVREPTLGVLVPFEHKRGGMLNGYRIGTYLAERLGVRAARPASDTPEGFLEVRAAQELDLRVSTSLRLADFISHDERQRDVWPKYVALSPRLLDKLELVIAEVARTRGVTGAGDLALGVHSGFRAPAYNARVKRAAGDSRHQYGDAADVHMDANGDGRITATDGTLVARAVETVEAANPGLVGGLGLYTSRRYRTPYVHIDTRGTKSRWRG